MSVVNLYNNIWRILANDNDILTFMNLVGADNLTKAKRIQKRARPQNIIDNLPLITFYTPDGNLEVRNSFVYGAMFVFDIYTSDDVELAHNIAQRIIDLFDREIHPMNGLESFESKFIRAYESNSNLANTYCFTVVLNMYISTDR